MKKEDKEILLRDLCARLSYGVIVEIISYGQETLMPWFGKLSCKDLDCFIHDVAYKSIKPYLRPLSSMTDEEIETYHSYCECDNGDFTGEILYFDTIESFDYLTSIHIDYRGLIPMGLAIEVTEENNPYKE